jgi:hypothetical protein
MTHAAIAQRGAHAVKPLRKYGKPWKETRQGAAVRNTTLQACQRLGRGSWKKWSGYHRRSLVEAKMHCFKRLGERVMARTFERQSTELHVRVALLKGFTQLGARQRCLWRPWHSCVLGWGDFGLTEVCTTKPTFVIRIALGKKQLWEY